MATDKPATAKQKIFIGIVMSLAGISLLLVGAGVLPSPGGDGNRHAPLWIVACIGLIFCLGGVALAIQGFGNANEKGELPAEAAPWLRTAQDLVGVALFASFALVGSWIAIGGEQTQFSSGSIPIDGGAKLSVARLAFGAGALICWAITITLAVSTARKRRDRH